MPWHKIEDSINDNAEVPRDRTFPAIDSNDKYCWVEYIPGFPESTCYMWDYSYGLTFGSIGYTTQSIQLKIKAWFEIPPYNLGLFDKDKNVPVDKSEDAVFTVVNSSKEPGK